MFEEVPPDQEVSEGANDKKRPADELSALFSVLTELLFCMLPAEKCY